MSLAPDRQLAHYRLAEKIGEGGMGVVWRAVDLKLDRSVAIKVLPPDVGEDAERIARFEREARVLASLNHSNIAAIYGHEEADGHHFLVLELAEGVGLDHRLSDGPMPIDETLRACRQVAEALEAAHTRGVVHRDLKPANIKISASGQIKVLDFGLAKALQEEGPILHDSNSPTVTHQMTRAGLILGTVGYMSPDQARGKPVDRRSDIWAFGCLLYECLTGAPAFPGETVTDVLGAILHQEPDWTRLPRSTPTGIRRLLRRCLQKDVERRQQDIADARIEIDEALGLMESGSPQSYPDLERTVRIPSPRWLAGAIILFAVGIAAGAGLWQLRAPRGSSVAAATSAAPRFSIAPGIDSSFPIVSPDGRAVAYVAQDPLDPGRGSSSRLYVRPLDRFEATAVAGGDEPAAHTFSPDGRWLAIVAPLSPRSDALRLSKVPVDGSSPPLSLAPWPEEMSPGIAWFTDGDIVGIRQEPLSIVRFPSDGGSPPAEVAIVAGKFKGLFVVLSGLPDGKSVLAGAGAYDEQGFRWNVVSIDTTSGEMRTLIEEGTIARWSPTGHLLFTRRDTLLATPFDATSGQVTGGPVTIADGLLTVDAEVGGWFDVSLNGTLVYQPGGVQGANRRLLRVDLDGALHPWPGDPAAFGNSLAVSPDGGRLAVSRTSAEGLEEIWISETEDPILRRAIAEPGLDCRSPVWTPDGARLAYFCLGDGDTGGVYLKDVETGDEPVLLLERDQPGVVLDPTSISPDGAWLLLERVLVGRKVMRLALGPTAGPGETKSMIRSLAEQGSGRVSPDGRWLAYSSDASGRPEIYLRRFLPDGSAGDEVAVSTTGGRRPIWSRSDEGLDLCYESEAGRLIAVPVRETGGRAVLGGGRQLVDLAALRADGMVVEPLAGGGFLLLQRGEEEEGGTIRVVTGWFDELRGRLPSVR